MVKKVSFVSIFVFLFLFLCNISIADDCLVASLKVKKKYKIDHSTQNGSFYFNSSFNLDAEGQVLFSIREGKLNIISKSISGSSSYKFSRDTPCSHSEGYSKGILIEGNMSKGKYAAYWKTDVSSTRTIKPLKGCMQEPPQHLEYTEEEEDYAFEGIVRPGMYKIGSLCRNVKSNPELGYCNETPLGFYGLMKKTPQDLQVSSIERGSPSKGENPHVEGYEIFEWYVKKVPCECFGRITDWKGNVKIDGMPLSGEGVINLSGAVVETGRRGSVTIEFGNATIKVGPNSSIDLTDTCQKDKEKPDKEKPSVLEVIKGSIRALIHRVGALGQPGEFINKTPNSVVGVRGTDFILISEEDKTVVMVLDGEISFWDINKRRTVTVKKNQKSECEEGAIPTNPVFFNPKEIPEWFR